MTTAPLQAAVPVTLETPHRHARAHGVDGSVAGDAARGAHDHDHDHDHPHAHGHDHRHDHGGASPTVRPPFSLIRASVAVRLALAVGLSGAIWLGVLWARLPIAG